MKKQRIYTIVVTVISVLLLGLLIFLLVNNTKQEATISEDAALNIILERTGTKKADITITSTDRDSKDNTYEIEFYDDQYEYDVEIDLVNGTILKLEKDIRKGVSVDDLPSENTISVEEAKTVVLDYLQLTEDAVNFTKSKLDLENGTLVYELEFSTDTVEYEANVNAHTKQIVKLDQTQRVNGGNANSSTDYIGIEKAKEIALTHANVSDVIWQRVEFDVENNIPVYEVEFFVDRLEYDYEINAISGDVIRYEVDRD